MEVARESCERFESILVEADGEADHLHLLIDYPPKVQLSKLIGAIKNQHLTGDQSKKIPRGATGAVRGDHFWSPSYMALSSGGATIETIREYIRNQRQPNKRVGRPKTS